MPWLVPLSPGRRKWVNWTPCWRRGFELGCRPDERNGDSFGIAACCAVLARLSRVVCFWRSGFLSSVGWLHLTRLRVRCLAQTRRRGWLLRIGFPVYTPSGSLVTYCLTSRLDILLFWYTGFASCTSHAVGVGIIGLVSRSHAVGVPGYTMHEFVAELMG